jgi:hypothetical protein
MGYDRAVLAQLPEFVRQQVPFLTTARGALDVQLLEFISSLAVSNVGFANITNRLQELTHTQYYRRQLIYLSYAKEAEAGAVAARGKDPYLIVCCKQAGLVSADIIDISKVTRPDTGKNVHVVGQ